MIFELELIFKYLLKKFKIRINKIILLVKNFLIKIRLLNKF
jgi:hypothetical protein